MGGIQVSLAFYRADVGGLVLMPTVIEPSETEPPTGLLGVLEPLGRGSIMALFEVIDARAQQKEIGKRFSYDYERRRLRLYGESEKSGDEVKRTQALYISLVLHTFLWMAVVALTAYGGARLQVAGSAVALGFSAVMMLSLGMVVGGVEAITHTEIVDHTTEPVDDCDDLKDRYLSGEIDEAELEAETEARLERGP